MSNIDPQSSGGATYRRLLSYVKGYWGSFTLAVFGMLAYSASEAGVAAFMKQLETIFSNSDPHQLNITLIFVLVIFVARSVGSFFTNYFMTKVARGVIKKLRSEMFNKLLRLPTHVYDASSSGELISTFTYNVEQVAESSTTVVTTLIKDTLTVIALLGWMFYLNPLLSAVFLIMGPLIAAVVYFVSSRFRRVSRRIQESMGQVTHVVDEAIDGHRVVKIFGGEDKEQTTYEQANGKNFKQHMKLAGAKGASEIIIQQIAGLTLVLIVFFAASGMAGEITVGVFISLISAILLLFPPLKRLTNVNAQLQKGIAAAESIFALLDSEVEHDNGTEAIDDIEGCVEYRHVNFAYTAEKGNVLHDISFDVRPGETIALVGRSGSGKSTIVNLLPRFYDVMQGEVLLDGKNINQYRLADLRNQMSYVGQHVTLFNDTIANNIAYGRLSENTSRDDICKAAERAYAMEFIKELPDGLDTIVGEHGVLLSGGQRQRLAIARALLKDSPILILDEATSALDSESEQHIQAALENLVQDRTTFVIAHRLSTVEKADKILVMEHGTIIEMGSHKELLKQNGQYASLYHLQFNTDSLVDEKPAETESADVIVYPQYDRNFLVEEPVATIWERMWYGHHWLAQLIWPVSYLFGFIAAVRKLFYKTNIFKTQHPRVPVIVIGNITVGGTGKTPLVIWMAEHLKKLGFKPGIISRGYKAKTEDWPLLITSDTDSDLSGDEASMIAHRTQCPVVIGPDRVEDARYLLDREVCDVIISDDGLQHYALGRDIEVIVADGSRGFGNELLLPAGPMREPKGRLKSADFIVTNGANLPDSYSMYVKGLNIIDLKTGQTKQLKDFASSKVHAVAAIGNPERFFELLKHNGIHVIEHVFPDHHDYVSGDLVYDDSLMVVMTEKDAVKCRKYADQFEEGQLWYVPVTASLSDKFVQDFNNRIQQVMDEQEAA